MKVIKKINNNVVICLDHNNRELVAFGRGIGFPAAPYELDELSKIGRTYYGVNSSYMGLVNEIPEEVFEVAAKIVDMAVNYIDCELSSNLVFTLADHINFAIQRLEKNMRIGISVQEDVKQLYPDEMEEAYRALKIIQEETGYELEQNEASMIALHFINNRIQTTSSAPNYSEDIITECLTIIQNEYGIKIDRKNFNFSRFATHIDYLLKRSLKNDQINSKNKTMFESIKKEYPSAYCCALNINGIFKNKLQIELNDEEMLYLMLHINRLCAREQSE